MKKLMTLLGVMAFALGAFAVTTNQIGFESLTAGDALDITAIEQLGDLGNAHLWCSAEEQVGTVTAYGGDAKYAYGQGNAALVENGPGANYLKLDAQSTLYRTLVSNSGVEGITSVDLSDDLVVDTLVQFTSPTESIAVPALDDGVKFAISLCTPEEGGATNLYVTAAGRDVTEDGVYYVATNYLVSAAVEPAEWYRVTVRAVTNIYGGEDSNKAGLGFVLYINGQIVSCGDSDYENMLPAFEKSNLATYLVGQKQLFVSIVRPGKDAAKAIAAVGFKGSGSVDDITLCDAGDASVAALPAVFKITWGEGIASFKYNVDGGAETTVADASSGSLVFALPAGAQKVYVTDVTYQQGFSGNSSFELTVSDGDEQELVSNNVQIVGGDTYPTLAAAIVAAQAGDVIQLLSNLEEAVAEAGLAIDYAITLDLNGKTLTLTGDASFDPAFYATVPFAIKSSVAGGKLDVTSLNAAFFDAYDEGPCCIVGAVEGDYGVTVDGRLMHDQLAEDPTAAISIVRGKFTDSAASTYVAEGSECTQVDNYYVIEPGEAQPTVIIITDAGATTNEYATLAAAIEVATNANDKVVLIADNEEDVTVPSGTTLNLDEGDYTFSGTFDGAGTVAMTAAPKAYAYDGAANGGTLFAETWAGTFQVAWNPGNRRFVLDDFGKANSTVEIVGVNGAFGAFPFSAWVNGGAPTVVTKVAIADGTTWTVSNGNGSTAQTTTIPLLTGGGNLVVNGGTGSTDRNIYYTITSLSGYTGTLSGSRCNFKIGNVVYDGEPTFGDCLVKVGENFGPYELSATKVNDASVALAVGTVGEQKGIYKAAASVGDNYYASIDEALAAADSATVYATTVTVFDTDSASDDKQGWSYSDGVYTSTREIATVDGTPYASLASAIAAAVANEKTDVVLLATTSEAVTIPQGITVSVTDDVVFSGKLSGAGAIKYTKAPATFNAAWFVNWTGTFVVAWDATNASGTGLQFNTYGVDGSVVEIAGDFTGYPGADSTVYAQVNPTVKVTGTYTPADGSSTTASVFKKVTGSGTINFAAGNKKYAIDALEDWSGTITCGSANCVLTNLVSGTGSVTYNYSAPQIWVGDDFGGTVTLAVAPQSAPAVSNGSECEVVIGYNWTSKADLKWYGGSNSTIVLTSFTGNGNNTYFPEEEKIGSKVRVAENGTVNLNNGWPLGAGLTDWTNKRVITMPALKVDGELTFGYAQSKEWTGYAYVYANVLDATGVGSIIVGNRFALRIDAVDFAEEPSGTGVLVDLTLAGETAGLLYGPNGVAGEQIPVTVNGVATEQTLVYDAEKGGLVLYVEPSQVIDPTDPTTPYPSTETTSEAAEAAAKEAIKVPDAAKSVVEATDYAEYFKYEVTGEAGAYSVAIVGIADDVVEAANESALEVLDGKQGAKVTVPAGLYYKVTTYTELGGTPTVAVESTLSDGTGSTISKPGTDKGFIKIEIDAKPIQ